MTALHQRLLATIAGREPTAAEETTLASTLSELPAVYHEALGAVLDRRLVRLALSDEDAAWSWQLQALATLLPSANLIRQGASMLFTLADHDLGLVVDGGDEPCLRVALDMDRRVTADAGGDLELHVRPALEPLVAACEVLCVAGCCGLSAFQIGPGPIGGWVAAAGLEAARNARRELDVVLAELEVAEGPVSSTCFNAVWKSAPECATFLEGMRRYLDAAMARTRG